MTTILRDHATTEALSVAFGKIDGFLQETHFEILRLEKRAQLLY